MVTEIVLFPKTENIQAIDQFISKYIVPAHNQSSGCSSITVSQHPLMSPFGAPPYSRVVVATLNSIQDVHSIGSSKLIQDSQSETPEGMQVIFYEAQSAKDT